MHCELVETSWPGNSSSCRVGSEVGASGSVLPRRAAGVDEGSCSGSRPPRDATKWRTAAVLKQDDGSQVSLLSESYKKCEFGYGHEERRSRRDQNIQIKYSTSLKRPLSRRSATAIVTALGSVFLSRRSGHRYYNTIILFTIVVLVRGSGDQNSLTMFSSYGAGQTGHPQTVASQSGHVTRFLQFCQNAASLFTI